MFQAAATTLAAVLWVVVLLRADRAPRPGADRSLWFVLFMFACAITAQWTPVHDVLNDAFGPFAAAWAWTSCAVLAAVGTRSFVTHALNGHRARDPRHPRLHLAVAGPALALVALAYAWAPTDRFPAPGTAPDELARRAPFYAGTVQSAVHWTVWLVLLTWALVGAAQVAGHYARVADRAQRGFLSTGLRLGALGCQVGVLYVIVKAVVIIAWDLDADARLRLVLDQVADSVAMTTIALILASSTGNDLLAGARATRSAVRRLVALHRLRHLWRVLYTAAPHDAAHVPPARLRDWLGNRVLEIRDRQLALRPYLGPDAPRRAVQAAWDAGHQGEAARTIAEAAVLTAALRAKRRGRSRIVGVAYDEHYEVGGGHDLDQEVEWLSQVAHAFAHSPLAAAIADDLDAAQAHPSEDQSTSRIARCTCGRHLPPRALPLELEDRETGEEPDVRPAARHAARARRLRLVPSDEAGAASSSGGEAA